MSDSRPARFLEGANIGIGLCRIHTEEVEWWKRVGVDPLEVARQLWAQTRAKGGSKGEWPELGSVGRAE